jgi:hypothetical protein
MPTASTLTSTSQGPGGGSVAALDAMTTGLSTTNAFNFALCNGWDTLQGQL